MVNYQNTIIYKLQCKDQELCCLMYYGSTTNMRVRKTQHKSTYNNIIDLRHNDKKYVTIRENGGWDNWEMVEVEKYPCNSNVEKRIREQYWISKYEDNLNMKRAYTSIEERKEQLKQPIYIEKRKDYYKKNKNEINTKHQAYYQDNKEEIKAKVKIYASNNKDKIKENTKKYYVKNKERLKDYQKQRRLDNNDEYKRRDKEKIKNRTIEQKDHIKNYKHDWYIANKERITAYKKRRTDCGCGSNYVTTSKSRHEKSQKHLNWLSTK